MFVEAKAEKNDYARASLSLAKYAVRRVWKCYKKKHINFKDKTG